MRHGNLSLTLNDGKTASLFPSVRLTSPHGTSHSSPRSPLPLVCDLQQTDTNSRVRIEEGGELQVWGEPWFTKSAITLMKPFKKEPSWILNNMRRNHVHWQRQRWNRQQQQKMTGGQHAGGATTVKPQPPFCSPFGPKISAGYTFWGRFDISPSYLKVRKGR